MDPLIQLLRQNARTPISDLARELNLSESAVTDRLAALEADGVVLGYQAVVDPQKALGSTVTAVVEVKITPERGGGFDRLASRIAKFSEVQSCYLMSGGYDLLVVLEGSKPAGHCHLHRGKAQHHQRRHFHRHTLSPQDLQRERRLPHPRGESGTPCGDAHEDLRH